MSTEECTRLQWHSTEFN